jgi:tripartite-type tricarboxylate transporter receptor subunit TctC
MAQGSVMKLARRRFLHLTSGATALAVISAIFIALTGHGALPQTTRTIRVIVPFPPGGSADIVARLLAEQIGRTQGPTIVVENRAGAGTVIGTQAVSHAAPDGNTVLFTNNAFVITPQVRKLNYDPLTSFEPICQLVSVPMVIVVNSTSPYRTLGDLLDAARAKPGELTLAATGPATAAHLSFEMLKRMASVDITFLPYPGTAPAISALLGDHVTSVNADYPTVAEQLKAGKVRALATPSRKRIELLPDVPTIAESGYRDSEADLWNGLLAPARTPKVAVAQLGDWFTSAMAVPETRAKLIAEAQFPVGVCGADFAVFIQKQYDEYGRIIREANIKAE